MRRVAASLCSAALLTLLIGNSSEAATAVKPATRLAATAATAAKPVTKPAARPATKPTGKSARTHADARLYLSWNAPYGSPRASRAIDAPCGDTTQVDTLYLSFDPGKDAPDFRGLTAILYFHPAEGASLTQFWKGGGSGLAGSPLTMEFKSDPEGGFATVWIEKSLGGPNYDFVQTSGRLRMIYANAPGIGPGVRGGKIYGAARVLVRRPAAGVDGCGAPMCVEWFSARIGYTKGEERDVNRGERHVSLNSPDGAVCSSVRQTIGLEPWRPK